MVLDFRSTEGAAVRLRHAVQHDGVFVLNVCHPVFFFCFYNLNLNGLMMISKVSLVQS